MKKRLNQTVVEKLSTEKDREDVWDAQYPQLVLILRKTGRKTWIYRYRADGKYHSFKIGIFPAVSVEAARDRWRELQSELAQGKNPAQDEKLGRVVRAKKRKDASITISDLLDRYDKIKLHQLRSRNQAISFLREFRTEFGDLPITSFQRKHFVDLTQSIALQGQGTKANRVHTHIKTFFNWCIGNGLCEYNPCDRVPKPYKEESCERYLSNEEIRYFWRATADDYEPWGRLGRLLLYTGQRLNECAQMTVHELREDNHWHLTSDRTKNKKKHDVFLPRQAVHLINTNQRVVSEAGYLFTTNGSSPVQSFDKPVKRLRARMNELSGKELKHFTYHDLRRTCETNLASLGTPQNIIDRVTNHITGRGMGRVYNMYDYRIEKSEALQKWADHIEELVV